MNITFKNPGADYMISRIMEFQGEGGSAFWSDPPFISSRSSTRPLPTASPFQKGANT